MRWSLFVDLKTLLPVVWHPDAEQDLLEIQTIWFSIGWPALRSALVRYAGAGLAVTQTKRAAA